MLHSLDWVDGTAVLVLAIWLYLVFARGQFWWLREFDDDIAPHGELGQWPRVVAIVPARNEAETIARSVCSLAEQNYGGELSVIVVDDHSEDETRERAREAALRAGAADRVLVDAAGELPAGWTGKLWALSEGVERAEPSQARFYWFTDADVVHAPDTLRRLVSRAETDKLALVSLMVLLRAESPAERLLIPPFLYFFLKLYPPRWVADPRARTAGAAGGCVLLRPEALRRSGGLAAIRDQVIDDCALATAFKRCGQRIWLGLTRASVSLRSYRDFAEIRDLIARTAFTQLRYSPVLLLGTLLGLLASYALPMALAFSGRAPASACGILAWALMTMSFVPTLWFYRLPRYWAFLMPLAALFYAYATMVSAVRFWRGRGARWKGRVQALPSP